MIKSVRIWVSERRDATYEITWLCEIVRMTAVRRRFGDIFFDAVVVVRAGRKYLFIFFF